MNRRGFFGRGTGTGWGASGVMGCLLLGTMLASAPAAHARGGDSVHSLMKKGEAAEAREDYDAAYDFFKKAYQKDPQNLRSRTAYLRLVQTDSTWHVTRGNKLMKQGDTQAALVEYLHATAVDPGNEAAIQQIQAIRAKETNQPLRTETSIPTPEVSQIEGAEAPAQLHPMTTQPFTLRYTQNAKIVYQAIGKAAGINVLFDPDYVGKQIQVDLTNVSLLDALRIVGQLSNTFWRPVTSNTIFVAQNTRAKRTELEEEAVQTFYLTNAWQQNDLNDVQTAIRNVLPNTKVYGVPSQNAIVMRATPDELLLAQKVINDLDKARPEVVVDVGVLEVDRDTLRNIGLSWPGSIGFALQPPQSVLNNSTTTTNPATGQTTTNTANLTLDNLANLNATNFAITVSSATANLLLTDSNTKILQNPRIRATDGQKATMKIGSRIPIATGSYQTGAAVTAIASPLVDTQFQYIDVGVNIEMTPTVHFDHDVTLKMKIEVSSESGTSTISGVTEPIISQRTVEQVIRLREGEANIIGGIVNKQDLVSITGIPGLGELPILRYIFGSKSREVIDDEIVFVLIPHVVRSQQLSPLNLRQIDTGAGQSIELRRTSFNTTQSFNQTAQSAVRGMNGDRSGFQAAANSLHSSTAEAAAPEALAQLRQSADPTAPPVTPTPQANATPQAKPAADGLRPGVVGLSMEASTPPPAVGKTFTVAVNIADAQGIDSVPLQIQYDATKMSLVNVDAGGFLKQDGQAVALVHRDDGPGLITLAASRPPGVAGVNGKGTICLLTFKAKQSGTSQLTFARPGALDSEQHPVIVSAKGTQIVIP